jgi:Protein of unknown function (DUF3293)
MSARRTPRDVAATAGLAAAYRRAIYRVERPEGAIDLRIGRRSARLERWLRGMAVGRWGFVTAVNPGSRRLPDLENERRLGRLGERLRALGHRLVPGVGLDPDGAWPDEPSFLVLEAEEAALSEVAGEFGQAAFVAGETDGPARLVWVAPCDRPEGALRRPNRAPRTRGRR